MKLSHEPAVTATLSAGLGTAIAVGAFLNSADMPAGWDWMETVLPVGIFVVYALVGLVIRPLVIPKAKVAATEAERLVAREDVKQQFTGIRKVEPRLPGRSIESSLRDPSGIRKVEPTTYTTGSYPGEHSKDPLPPPQ